MSSPSTICHLPSSAPSDPSALSDSSDVPRGSFCAPEATALETHEARSLAAADTNNRPILPAPSLSPISHLPSPISPITDVPSYLRSRSPQPHFTTELPLFITLPESIRSNLRTLLGDQPGGGLFGSVQSLIKSGLSTHKSCSTVLSYSGRHASGLERFRKLFALYSRTRDWTSLVDRTKARWKIGRPASGLPDAFLTFCAQRFAQYVRADAKCEAWRSICRQYRTGLNNRGEPEPIPGYTQTSSQTSSLPPGWSYSNILREIHRRRKFTPSVRALLHESTAAARAHLPQVHSTRKHLRFLERVQFDDIKTDFLVFDPRTGQACDLWLLIAHDVATTLLLGFGMRPARTRDDGKQDHLKLRDMKQLCGWILERFGLPPYTSHWVLEHGTATLSDGSCRALAELLGRADCPQPAASVGSVSSVPRIQLHFSQMLGGPSPTGYLQRGKGNSQAKASLESHNRLIHIIGADLPGQTGRTYDVRPADLSARAKEATQIWERAQLLPEHLRTQVGYPVLTIEQARLELRKIFHIRNSRTDHNLEGFDEVPGSLLPDGTVIKPRKQSPLERAQFLLQTLSQTLSQTFSPVSPDLIKSFYEHTARTITRKQISESGHIEFQYENKTLRFLPPTSSVVSVSSVPSVLAYFHPDDPAFLHLTDGAGRFLGTWLRETLVSDDSSLTAAIRYQQAALSAAQAVAHDLAAPQRARLDHMRSQNSSLFNDFHSAIEVGTRSTASQINSPVASALSAVATERSAMAARRRKSQSSASSARASLMSLP